MRPSSNGWLRTDFGVWTVQYWSLVDEEIVDVKIGWQHARIAKLFENTI